MTANRLEELAVQCPYCWQTIQVLIDCSVEAQEYIEDCQVCCRPIVFDVLVDDDGYPTVNLGSDES
ncbi:MAG: CPXCG motif-containing cysteine-rich protein [Gammaproteobacteria bacterium]|nr:CPXCG motif-containing cysteine-rich protein [Gammaproteobacteria bacterium]